MRVAFFVIFLLDLVAGSIFKFNYNLKLVWWLDFVSAISMFPLENFNSDSGEGFSLNYLVALKAFKVARATRLLKMVGYHVGYLALSTRMNVATQMMASSSLYITSHIPPNSMLLLHK